MEFATLAQLQAALSDGRSLHGVRLQNLDLRPVEADLLARTDLEGCVVLGGHVTARLARHLAAARAVVLPPAPGAPVDPYRAELYDPHELYAGLAERGYAATPDARASGWSTHPAGDHDVYTSILQATHDAAMADALDEVLAGREVVGVMGGHALRRGTTAFGQAARLAARFAGAGLVVATGGGPGAMEAANLGAFARDEDALGAALDALSAVPDFNDVDAWADVAFRVRDVCGAEPAGPGRPARSIGIPTWFYGNEPPNVFCDAIAKFFSNAVREDGLLSRSGAGVVVLPGAAGTVQEVFQAVTPRYYSEAPHVPALVLVGSDHWTRRIPVWPALQALGTDRALGRAVRLVDGVDEAADAILSGQAAG